MEYAEFYHDAMTYQKTLTSEQFQTRHPEHYLAWQQVMRYRLANGGA